MKRIGIVAALPGELKPLVRGWNQRGKTFVGRIGPIEAVAACSGMGAKAVTHACQMILASGNIDTLASVGWAGSLSCGLRAPEACSVREVIDDATGERFPTDDAKGHRLITLNRVADQKEKRRLAEQYQAVLVDMESATVARLARAKNLGFLCWKAVTDGPNDKLPDFNRFLDANGQMRMPALVAWSLVHPQHWNALGQLEKNSRLAAAQLAAFVSRRLSDSQ